MSRKRPQISQFLGKSPILYVILPWGCSIVGAVKYRLQSLCFISGSLLLVQSGESIDGENKNFPNLQKAWLCDDSPFDFVVFGSTIKSILRPRTGSGTQDLCHTVYIFPTQCQLFIPPIQTTTNNKTTDREQCEKSLD